MQSQASPYGKAITIDRRLRAVILTELIVPTVLLIFGIYHGLLQVLYRAGVIRAKSFLGIEYYQGLTLHGAINAVVFTTFFAIAFGNALVPYALERPIATGPAVASAALMLAGSVLAAIAAFTGQASVLYTFYAPMIAHPIFYVGLVLLVVGSWIGFFNWVPAYTGYLREGRAPKAPIGVVLMLTAFLVWFLATIPVAIEILFQLLPLSLGLTHSMNVVLSRMLFWAFGHPLVYFWILPAYAMYYSMLPALAGGKIYSDFAGRFAAMTLLVFSSPVGIHHQFTEPAIGQGWKILHTFFTFFVAIPSFMTAFSTAASLELGARARGGRGLFRWWARLPYLDTDRFLFAYFFAGLFVFIFGGITGVINASFSMNNVVHNTAWQPAHFHMTVAGPVFLAFIGMTLFLCSRLTGREIVLPRLNVWVPYLFIFGECIFSGGLFWGGLNGEPRRTNLGLTYTNPASNLYHPEWAVPTVIGAVGGTIMTVAMLCYFVVFFGTLAAGRRTEPVLQLPVSETFHDEHVPAVWRFKPWLVGAIVALVIAYTFPLYEVITGHYGRSPAYNPASPNPVSKADGR